MEARSRHQSARIATVVSGVLRALSICTPAALLDAPATLARAVEPAPLTADIPAQPLAQALEAFARQTGLQLVYVSGVVRDQRCHAVSAGLSADEALARMLKGTELKFEYLTPRSIRILAAVVGPPRETTTRIPSGDELQEVIVTANRREENRQNVPMTIQVLTGATLAKLNATTFDDFAKYLPGVTAHGVGPGMQKALTGPSPASGAARISAGRSPRMLCFTTPGRRVTARAALIGQRSRQDFIPRWPSATTR